MPWPTPPAFLARAEVNNNWAAAAKARGVVALRDITYFGGFLVLALFLTQRSIEAIRFKRS